MGFNCLKATEPLLGDSLFFTTRDFLVLIWSTSERWKTEFFLKPLSVLNKEPLGWDSSTLTTEPLRYWSIFIKKYYKNWPGN